MRLANDIYELTFYCYDHQPHKKESIRDRLIGGAHQLMGHLQ